MSNPGKHPGAAGILRRILVIQTAFLGDMVLTTPLLRELRRIHPEVRLWVLATATGGELLGALDGVERCLLLDKRWDFRGWRSLTGVVRELVHTRFDATVAAQRSLRTGFLVRLSGAPVRVGFAGAAGAWSYNRRVTWSADSHAARRYLDLAVPLGGGAPEADARPALTPDPRAIQRVERVLARHGLGGEPRLLVVAPGSVWATKRWIPEGFGRVIAAGASRGLAPVLIGSESERELCREVATHADAPILAGELAIPELVALLARARVLVGNDSGPGHVAAAVDTPVISIFGSTSSEAGCLARGAHTAVVEHPDLHCRPCGRHGRRRCPERHFRCMREIDAEQVIERLDELLAASATGAPPGPVQPTGDVLPG